MSTVTQPLDRRWINPLTAKEFRSRMRSRAVPVTITLFLALVGGVAFFVYLVSTAGTARRIGGGNSEAGTTIFYFLIAAQLIAASFITPAGAAASIASERQRGTLQLLLGTALSPARIVLSKFWVSMGYALLFICVTLPMFSLPLLLGGIEPLEVLMAVGVVLASALLYVSVGLFVSARVATRTLAIVLTYVITLGLLIGLPVLLLMGASAAQGLMPGTRTDGLAALQTGIELVFGLLLGLSPLAAIVGSRSYFELTGDMWLYRQPIFSAATGVTLPAPWLTLIVVYTVLSIILLFAASRRITLL
jgi:ABC-type transport system involved in multi-copper enzyme maturation permease subunit